MKNKTKARLAAIVAGVMAMTVAVQGISWNTLFSEKATAKDFGLVAEASENAGDWVHFYNDDLQNDGDKDNDFNFGPNPYAKSKTAAEYDTEFRERLKVDTALAAADTAWLDANVGTRYLGEFYKSCKKDWAKTMNEAKETFSKDQESYYKNLDAFFAYLDSAEKVEVRKCTNVTDQMYMNPYTPNVGMQMPDVIVLKTHNQKGHELVYTFKIKGEKFKVAYRIECGFQPTNVAKKMKITLDKDKDKTTSDKDKDKTTTPDKDKDKTTPDKDKDKTTTPDKKKDKDKTTTPDKDKDEGTTPEQGGKDPSKAPDENTEPNDNPGSGKDTNSGGNKSTEEKPTNSNNYSSYDDYKKDVEDLKKTNEVQQTPQNNPNSTPSTPPPTSNTTVDNNGKNGTGNGGIDKPTEVTKPATEADTGKPIKDTATESIDEPK